MSLIKPAKIALAVLVMSTPAYAKTNLTGETTPPTEIAAQAMFGVAEFAAESGLANIQIAAGQTLTNSVQNVAEGKTDIAAAPFVLPFLMSKGAGPYASLGPEKGANCLQISPCFTPTDLPCSACRRTRAATSAAGMP